MLLSAAFTDLHPLQHMETFHAEAQSPSQVDEEIFPAKGADDEYVECPIDSCGEVVLMREIGFHIELHAEEEELDRPSQGSPDVTSQGSPDVTTAEGVTPGPSRTRSPQPSPTSSRQQNAIQTWRSILSMPSSKRQAVKGGKPSPVNAVRVKRLGVRKRSPVCGRQDIMCN